VAVSSNRVLYRFCGDRSDTHAFGLPVLSSESENIALDKAYTGLGLVVHRLTVCC
jgi:TolA-binding protein